MKPDPVHVAHNPQRDSDMGGQGCCPGVRTGLRLVTTGERYRFIAKRFFAASVSFKSRVADNCCAPDNCRMPAAAFSLKAEVRAGSRPGACPSLAPRSSRGARI